MPSFCKSHLQFYTFGGCPKCATASVLGRNFAAPPQLAGRWNQLTANPDLIDQDQFGVCGMTSAVHLLLRHQPNVADQLFRATFADVIPAHAGTTFTTGNHQNIAVKFRYLARRYHLQEQDNLAEVAAAVPAAHRVMVAVSSGQQAAAADLAALKSQIKLTCFVDFCVSRALGYIFKKVAEPRYNGEKAQFNAAFDPGGQYRNVTHLGSLALRTNNLAFIMKEILGAQHVHVASRAGGGAVGPAPVPLAPAVGGVTTSTFANVTQLAAEFTNRLAVPNSFALGAIFADIVKNTHVPAPSGQGTNPNLAYNHWIVMNSFTRSAAGGVPTCPDAHADIGIWTWARNYNARICEPHAMSYVQDVIFGHF